MLLELVQQRYVDENLTAINEDYFLCNYLCALVAIKFNLKI